MAKENKEAEEEKMETVEKNGNHEKKETEEKKHETGIKEE